MNELVAVYLVAPAMVLMILAALRMVSHRHREDGQTPGDGKQAGPRIQPSRGHSGRHGWCRRRRPTVGWRTAPLVAHVRHHLGLDAGLCQLVITLLAARAECAF